MNTLVIDATQAPLGRLASFSAKKALLGNKVEIVHCEKAIVIGAPRSVIDDYKAKRKIGGANFRGPFFPKYPEQIVKRTVRGMLPFKNPRGKEAIKKVICHVGVPEKLKETKKIELHSKKKLASISLGELSKEI